MFRVEKLSAADLHQWLNSGWGFTKLPGETEVRLTRFQLGGDSTVARLQRFVSPTEYDESMQDLHTIEVYCHWPAGGAINIPIGERTVAAVMDRITEKQYRRTYCPQWALLEVPRLWEVMKVHGKLASKLSPSNTRAIWAAFFPDYYSSSHAIREIREGRMVSAAISPHIILIGDGQRIFVYDKAKHVGHIDDTNHAVVTHENEFVAKRVLKQLNMKLAGGM